jgi:uncharacterized protein (TIGR03084 family)
MNTRPQDHRGDVFEALAHEQRALESMLDGLSDAHWEHASLCLGWSVSDVVLHLAQTEEGVVAALTGEEQPIPPMEDAATIDDVVEQWVRVERGKPAAAVLDRWKVAYRKAMEGLRTADPQELLAWAAAPLKPRTLATTRLSEHWIHANDIAGPLGIDYPDTDRLWHITRLAHRTVPYSFARAGRSDPPSVRLELTSPVGEPWDFGPEDADCTVRGSAGEFCRVAGRRLSADEAHLETMGERAVDVLELVRTYA